MSQQDDHSRQLLLGRIRTALERLDDSETPDDATLARLARIFEEAARIIRFSGHYTPGHFLSFLQELEQALNTEVITPMEPDFPSNENVGEGTSLPSQTTFQPPVDNEPVAPAETRSLRLLQRPGALSLRAASPSGLHALLAPEEHHLVRQRTLSE